MESARMRIVWTGTSTAGGSTAQDNNVLVSNVPQMSEVPVKGTHDWCQLEHCRKMSTSSFCKSKTHILQRKVWYH